jgi:DNA-binding beta-propeller fold protein YncE
MLAAVGARGSRAWIVRLVVGIAVLGAAAIAVAATSKRGSNGVIGPKNRIQPNGRKVVPAGKLTKLGNHPYGGALTPNGKYLWTLSAGRGINDIRIVAATGPKKGKVVQKLVMPGLSGGIVFDPKKDIAYVSGLRASPHTDETPPASVPGQQGDVIQIVKYSAKTGKASYNGLIPVPAPSDAPPYQEFPPQATETEAWPQELALSPDGKTLLAALNLSDAAAVVNTKTKSVQYVNTGHYPYGAVIDRAGHGFVTSETQGTVSEINLANATKIKDIQAGAHLSHIEGMAMDPKLPRAYAAVTAEDQIAVIDTNKGNVERTLSVARPPGNGSAPVRVSVTPDGCYLLAADSGEDAIAVFALPNKSGKTCGKNGGRPKPWKLVGRIPTAAYPVAAQVSKQGVLAWVTAKGLGVGPNPNGPNPNSPNDSDNNINSFQYLPSIIRGESGILNFPSTKKLKDLTPKADREIVPTDSQNPPKGTPLRANGPIKHVFYIVRENRTYDQVLGDDSRGDGDKHLTLFGKNVTPNLHALAQRFPLLDHVYADSEASIDGHYWTAAGAVSDYVVRSWHQNYAGRGRPYDFGAYQVSAPPKGYVFSRLLSAKIPFFNYGEALAGLNSLFPDKDRNTQETQDATNVLANSDIQLTGGCYDGDIAIFNRFGSGQDVYDSSLPPGANPATSVSRFDCFKTRFESQLATNSVPAFNYVVLPLDHTQGVSPGKRTPTADIADNDWALGQFVDEISHSPIWKSSLIVVQEDDSQDGADHVDAHRIPALAISPYTKKGAVVHNRYDQLSILRTAELVLGLKPKYLAEALAAPMYDAFTKKPSNSAPYDAITPGVDLTATNPNTAANRRASRGLPLNFLDEVPQRQLDAILWRSRHPGTTPPPPGPNASSTDGKRVGQTESSDRFDAATVRKLRRALRRHSAPPLPGHGSSR